MRFIEGQTLDRLLESQGPLGWHEALMYLCQISDALVFAHGQALVHRDIKPQNIMISPKEGAVLTDFGLVRAMEVGSVGTQTGTLMGTPAYIAPEIWRGQPATPAADQYSLGCVVVEMLTGRRLFGGPTPPAVMQQHLLEGPRLPGDWPDDLSALVRQALSQDPAARFADMEAFRTALQSLQLNVAGQMATETNLSATRRPVLPPVVERTTDKAPTWGLEEGLTALKEMEADQEWQLALETLEQLEAAFPGHIRLKLPRKKITRVLTEERSRNKTTEKIEREAERYPGYLRRDGERVFIRLDAKQDLAFIRIPAGEFLMGSDPHNDIDALSQEQPQHRVILPEYWIGQAPITNAQFDAFVRATGYRTAAELEGWSWIWDVKKGEWLKIDGANWLHPGGAPSDIARKADHPVVQVNWHDAVAYCEWLSRLTGRQVRLPTEAEWEKAARGSDGRIYPWGSDLVDAQRCNYGLNVEDTSRVGQYSPAGDSPYGCVDMSGNVWDWCADWYAGNYYASSPGSSPPGSGEGKFRVVRGGSWHFQAWLVRSAYRLWCPPVFRNTDQGFRCLLAPNPKGA
jgi:serine/threonine-protein kinase